MSSAENGKPAVKYICTKCRRYVGTEEVCPICNYMTLELKPLKDNNAPTA